MSIILGLNSGHDGSACIVKDGKIVVAVGSERVTRVKKQESYTDQVIDYVLEAAGIEWDEIDHIVNVDHKRSIWGNDVQYRELDKPIFGTVPEVPTISHHTAHAAASYYTSGFDKSWVFTLDSSWGDGRANSSICLGEGDKLFWQNCPLGHEPYIQEEYIGCMYSIATLKLGLGSPLYKAGTTMGLACYGVNPPTDFNFFNYDPKEIDSDKPDFLWAEDFQDKADIALACQTKFEDTVLRVLADLDLNKSSNLCLGGGSMLNCTLNGKIVKQTDFTDFQVFPACGDDGLAVGAALYWAHHVLGEPRQTHSFAEQCYTGRDYPMEAEPDYEKIAQLIADGNIIGWFSGKSEFGPRALGNRSILADPRTYHTRERINHHIKGREWFRPFAPVVLEEETDNWFDWQIPSPFMLYTAQVRKPGEIQAVTHVDNSARLQTVNQETNPHYYNLIKAFGELTGVPVLLNTSLNENGQPIIETPDQALDFLNRGKLNYMVINGIIYKA